MDESHGMLDLLKVNPEEKKEMNEERPQKEQQAFTVTTTADGTYSKILHKNVQLECIRRGLSTEGLLMDMFARLAEDDKAKVVLRNVERRAQLEKDRKRKRQAIVDAFLSTTANAIAPSTQPQSTIPVASRQAQFRFLRNDYNKPYVFIPFAALYVRLEEEGEDLKTIVLLFHTFNAQHFMVGHTGYIATFKHHIGGDAHARQLYELLPKYLPFKFEGVRRVMVRLCEPNEPDEPTPPQPDTYETKSWREAPVSSIPLLPIIGERPYIKISSDRVPTDLDVLELREKVAKTAPDFVKADETGIYICYAIISSGTTNMELCMKRELKDGFQQDSGEVPSQQDSCEVPSQQDSGEVPSWVVETSTEIRKKEEILERANKKRKLEPPEASLPRLSWEVTDFLAAIKNFDAGYREKETAKVIDAKRHAREEASRKRLLEANPQWIEKLRMAEEKAIQDEAERKRVAEDKLEAEKEALRLENIDHLARNQRVLGVLRERSEAIRKREEAFFSIEPEYRVEQHITFKIGEMERFGDPL